MCRERSDDNRVAFLFDASELGDAGQIDDGSGIGQPQLHRSDETLSAGKRLATAFRQRRHGIGHRFRSLIFECVHD